MIEMADERSITARFTADTSGFSPKVNELIQHLKSLNSEYAANEQEIKRLNTEMKSYQKELQTLEQKQRSEQGLTEKETAQMQSLRDSIARCATELGTYRSAQSTLRSEINSTSCELNEQRDAVNGVSNAAASFGDVLKANIISDAIHTGLQKTLELLKSAAAYCYDVGTSFESAMSQVEAISGASGSQLEALTNKAKQLGSTTKFTATQAAEAMNYMAMASWDANQMLSGIDGVLSLAAASGEDLGTTSDIVTDALTAFGLKADDVGHFSDVLAAASASANTNVSMLGESFKYVAPLAGTMGYTIDEVAESLGIMANSGIKASTAGTSMRTMLTNLTSGVTITSKAFGEMKISAANSDGSMKSLNAVLGELRTAFAQMTPQEKSMNAETIAGERAMTGFLALMNAGADDVNKLRGAIENCDGAAAKMAETMQDNLAGKVTILESALEGLGNSVYEKFAPALKETVEIFTDCLSDMTASVEDGELNESISHLADSFHSAAVEIADLVSDNLPDFIDGIAKTLDFIITFRKEIASAVKGFVAFKAAMAIGNTVQSTVNSFKSLTSAITGANTAQTALNGTMAASTGPLGIAAAAIGALVFVFSEFAAHADDCNDRVRDLQRSSEEAMNTAEEYREQANGLDDVKERYDKITASADDAATKTANLKTLQDELIAQYPSLKDEIDLVTGAYDEQAAALERLAQKNREAAIDDAEMAVENGEAGEKQEIAVHLDSTVYYDLDDDEYKDLLEEKIQSLSTFAGGSAHGRALFGGTYEQRAKDFRELYDFVKEYEKNHPEGEDNFRELKSTLNEQAKEMEKAAEQLTNARKLYDDLTNPITPITPDFSGTDDRGIPWSAYIDPNDRSKGFKHIVDDVKDTTERIADAVNDGATKVKNSLDEVKSAYKSTLDAIDAELEKHNRDKKDEEYQTKIDALNARLKYEQLDDFSRIALEKQLADINDEWDEVKYQRNAADVKSMLNTVYTQAQSAVDYVPQGSINQWNSAISAAMEQIGGAAGNTKAASTANSAVYNIVINAQNKTTDQIVREVTAAISKRAV